MSKFRHFPPYTFLFLLILDVNHVLGCPDFENVISEGGALPENAIRPNIALRIDQPRREDIKKFVHQLEPNVVLVNITGILTLRLDCWAPYPIDLQFSGHLTNQETTVKTFRKEFGPKSKPKSCFIINATMESYEEITGNYSCVAVENPSIFSSYYIFVSVNPPGVLLTRGQKINLQVKPQDKKIIFPCAVSHPEVHVQLLKDSVSLSRGVAYDPRLGFTMTINAKDDSIYGSYSCLTELSPKDRVNFTVLPPKNFEAHPPVNHIHLLPNGRLQVVCSAVEEFIITTIPPTIPYVKNEVGHNQNSELYKYLGSYESEPLSQNKSGYVSCKWKATNEPFAEWAFSVRDPDSIKPGHLDTTKFKTECSRDAEIILYECSNVVECKINSCVRKDSKCQSNGRICRNDKSCMNNGLVQCPSSRKDQVSEIFFTGFPRSPNSNHTNRYVEWKHAPEKEILQLKELSSPYPITAKNSDMKFSCQGSNFVFSSGFKWFLIHGNGTRSALSTVEGNRMNISVNNSWKEKKSNLESTLTLPLASDIGRDVTHVECSAPIWNSWRWISQRIPIDEKKFTRKSSVRLNKSKANSATFEFPFQNTWSFVLIMISTLMMMPGLTLASS